MDYFETIKCDDFEVFNLDYHQERIAKTVGLNINLGDYIYPSTSELLKCKIIYDDMGVTEVTFTPYKKRDINSFAIIYDDNIQYSKKSVDRTQLDLLFSQKESADEIIIIKNGLVTDTSIANIAIFDGTNWITSKQPLLEGTTRARLLDEGEIFEKDITVKMLKDAKKIALLNAMIGMDILEDYCLYL